MSLLNARAFTHEEACEYILHLHPLCMAYNNNWIKVRWVGGFVDSGSYYVEVAE